MPRDDRVDAYIARQAQFARPILTALRATVERHCPDAQEAIKWSSPAWIYDGQLLCSMAAFKAHATFGFWRGVEVMGEVGRAKEAMGQFGRMTSVDDLPDDAIFGELIARAVALIGSGTSTPRVLKHPKPELVVPAALQVALDGNAAAAATFAGFSPSNRREYVEWVADAKRSETRDRRIAQTIEWLADGKRRNWKYEQC